MGRSIKQLRIKDSQPSEEEIQAAALQFVRKVSGVRKPSRGNQAAFDSAVAQVALATQALLARLSEKEAPAARVETRQ